MITIVFISSMVLGFWDWCLREKDLPNELICATLNLQDGGESKEANDDDKFMMNEDLMNKVKRYERLIYHMKMADDSAR